MTATQNNFDDVTRNGITLKKSNIETKHQIPLGALVEIQYENLYTSSNRNLKGVRLFVAGHTRDDHNTPTYALSHNRSAYQEKKDIELQIANKEWLKTPSDIYAEILIRFKNEELKGQIINDYTEDDLKVIELPK